MKNLISVLILSLILTIPATAHAEHAVGFAAGSTRGVGATYRFLPDPGDASPWGWQVTGLPFVTRDGGTVSAGGALIYLLHRGREAMAYASLGVGGLVTWNTCDENDEFCEDESHWGLGAGPGLGFELRVMDNVAWSVEIPLAVMFADNEFYGLYPVPNSSLVFYW